MYVSLATTTVVAEATVVSGSAPPHEVATYRRSEERRGGEGREGRRIMRACKERERVCSVRESARARKGGREGASSPWEE